MDVSAAGQDRTRWGWWAAWSFFAVVWVWQGMAIADIGGHMMDSDEATHTLRSVQMAADLARGDLLAVWDHAQRPHWYPPVHHVLQAVWLALVGVSVTSARLYSWVCFAGMAGVLGGIARTLDRSAQGWAAALVVAALGADAHLRAQSSLSMLEAPGGLALVGTLAVGAWSVAHGSIGAAVAASCLGWVSFGIKYSNGLLAFAGLAGIALVAAISRPEARGWRGPWVAASLVGPAAVLTAWWMVGLGHLASFEAYRSAQRDTYARWSIDNLTYYPEILAYGTGVTTAFAFLAVLLPATVPPQAPEGDAALLTHRRALIAGLASVWVVGLAGITWTRQNDPRFIAVLLPIAWALCVPSMSRAPMRWRAGHLAGVGALFAGVLLARPPAQTVAWVDEEPDDVVGDGYQAIYEGIGRPSAVVRLVDRRGSGAFRDAKRSTHSESLAIALYQGCAAEHPLSACRYDVWDPGVFRRVAKHRYGRTIDRAMERDVVDFVVDVAPPKKLGRRAPRWSDGWPEVAREAVGHGVLAVVWARPEAPGPEDEDGSDGSDASGDVDPSP